MSRHSYLHELETQPDVVHAAKLVQTALTQDKEPLGFQSNGPTLKVIWIHLRGEVHDILCTESEKYKSERALIQTTYKPVIAALAAYLMKDFGLPLASASALASLALLLPLKMLVASWCKAVGESSAQLARAELVELKQLTQRAEANRIAE